MKRRDFIKTVSAAAAGSGLIGRSEYENLPVEEHESEGLDVEVALLKNDADHSVLPAYAGERVNGRLRTPSRMHLYQDGLNWLSTVDPVTIDTSKEGGVIDSYVVYRDNDPIFFGELLTEIELTDVGEISLDGIALEIR